MVLFPSSMLIERLNFCKAEWTMVSRFTLCNVPGRITNFQNWTSRTIFKMNDFFFSKNIKTRYPSHREAPNSAACTILSIGRLPSWLFSSLSSRSASRRVNRQFTTLKLSSSNQLYFSCLYHIKLIKFCVYQIVFSVLKDISLYIYSLSSGEGTECPLVAIFWFHPF